MSSRRPDARRAAPPERRGFLSGMSAPPLEDMPRIRTAFTRGLAATWSSPVVVGAVVAWLFVEWVALVAFGYPGPLAILQHLIAPPPLATTTDLGVSIGTFGVALGLPLVLIVGAVHAVGQAILLGLAIESIEGGRPSRWGAVRGLRAVPVAVALHVLGVAMLFASRLLASVGGSFALLLLIAIVVLGVWAFAFAPVIAIAEGRSVLECLRRSVRAARMPGSANLTFATLYVLPMYAALNATISRVTPGSTFDVNPPATAWVYVVLLNLLHVAIWAALAMRYLAIADRVPDAPAPRAAPRHDGGRAHRRW
jgi:hypothetical protein